MRFVVYGAGAIGGVLGAHLALHKHDVLLICRADHAEAIGKQNGLRLKSATGEYVAAVRAATKAERHDFDSDTCIFFTPKSNHTESGVSELVAVAPLDAPIVSFQNGVINEQIIGKHFENTLGGVCRMTCSFLQPGQVSFRKMGRVIVGKYPKGADPFAKKLGKVLAEAGFAVGVSNSIQCDKWLKLVVNLQSAFHAIIDSRDHDTMEFTDLKLGVLEEAKRVLRAEKIRTKSCDGQDSSIDEIMEDLRKPHAPRSPSVMRVNNSTWQNLYLKRNEIESSYFHGPIIELGKLHGIPVPFNEVALELVTTDCEEQVSPNTRRASEILQTIKDRSEGS